VHFPLHSGPVGTDAGIRGAFPVTRWSVVLDAQGEDPEALASFCRAYWFPLYSYARRMGIGVEDAHDLTQAFFERILSRDLLAHARRERGRLRTFLLRCFNNFVAEDWRRASALKRGGTLPVLAIDSLSAEERLALEPRDTLSPELEFERAWARELLRQTLSRLQAEYEAAGRGAVFHRLRDQLMDGTPERPYGEVAVELGLSEASTRFAAFKLRQRYREVLRELVADTVAGEDEVEVEITHLRRLFQG